MPSESILSAYIVGDTTGMPIVTAPHQREWMDATSSRFAYRCLPVVLANQAGWLIQNPVDFTATWNGGAGLKDVKVDFPNQSNQVVFQATSDSPDTYAGDPRIISHFGSGIITISIPYLFRTPRGVNLWVKGPSNYFKDGVCPLEGIVEADWSPATFTMNWKLTRPGLTVHFTRGEPICMIVPVPRGVAESLEPRQALIDSNSKLRDEYSTWDIERRDFMRALNMGTATSRWQKDYTLGRSPDGSIQEGHQTRIVLKEFVVDDDE